MGADLMRIQAAVFGGLLAVSCSQPDATSSSGSAATASAQGKSVSSSAASLAASSGPATATTVAVPSGAVPNKVPANQFCSWLRQPSPDCGEAERKEIEAEAAKDRGRMAECEQAITGAFADKNVTWDEEAAAECVRSFQKIVSDSRDFPAGCAKMLLGTLKEGAACRARFTCAPGLYCANTATQGGTCKKLPVAGEACEAPTPIPDFLFGGEHPTCASGLYCNRTCQTKVAKGGSCQSAWRACVSGTTCLDDTCQELGRDGAPCSTEDHCAAGFNCAKSAEAERGKCVPKGRAGEPCTDASSCRGICTANKCVSFCGSG